MLPFNNHTRLLLSITSLTLQLFFNNNLNAQVIHYLPPNQPEQDACGALTLCGNSFYTPYSYQGTGKKLDINSTPCYAPIGGGEVNSVWLKLNISTAGKIVFKIIPVNHDDDYDFAVLNISKTDCGSLSPDDVVRCNFNNNLPGSNLNGIIGLSIGSSVPYVPGGAFGNSFCQAIDAAESETYLVMINNFGNYVTPNSGSEGFTIDFTGSTAVFNHGNPPTLSNINVPCNNASGITLHLSTEVLCSSIAADGSDFTSSAPVAIKSAAGVNCSNDTGYTNTITVGFASALPGGSYALQAQKGSDNNTLLNLCNVALVLPSEEIPFTVLPPGAKTTVSQSICFSQIPYLWNGITLTKGGDSVATYTTLSSGGCDSVTVLNLAVGTPPKQSAWTTSKCSWRQYALPWDSTTTTGGTFIHHYTNAAGCDTLVLQFTLTDVPCSEYLYIPTAFTPNNDEVNDIFKPTMVGRLAQYRFEIYDRWGKRVFFTTDISKGWDGTLNSYRQPAGIYVWVCRYELAGESLQTEKGTVTLIR
jgi:gliding motility-associated-like protein